MIYGAIALMLKQSGAVLLTSALPFPNGEIPLLLWPRLLVASSCLVFGCCLCGIVFRKSFFRRSVKVKLSTS